MPFIDYFTNHPIIKKYPFLRQLVKFIMVGFVNLTIDFALYLFCTRILHLHYLISNIISFTGATVNSYILNKKWTFRDTSANIKVQYLKFYIANGIGLGINQILLYILVDHFHFFDIFSKCVAVVIVTFWNFFINKFWTFKNKS